MYVAALIVLVVLGIAGLFMRSIEERKRPRNQADEYEIIEDKDHEA